MGDRDTISRGGLLSKRRELYSRCRSRCRNDHYTKTAKHIKVYINGDNHFSGKRFTVNEKQTPSLDTLLYDITRTIKPVFGAVRELYTPYGGTQIEDISQLKMGGQYVAAGKGRLKTVDYNMIEVNRPAPVKKTYSHIKPVVHNKGYNIRAPVIRSRYAECMQKPVKIIFIYANGSPETCIKILLGGWQICNFNWILSEISSRVGLRMGCAVRRLHTLQGDMITRASQLENNMSYVACGLEKMKRMGYGSMSNNLLSPRTQLKTREGGTRYDASGDNVPGTVPPQLAKDITLPPIRIKLPERSEEFVRCHSRNSTERIEMSKKVKTIFSPRLHSRCQSRGSPAMKNVYHSEAIESKARTVADSDDIKVDEPIEALSARSVKSDKSASGGNAPTPSGIPTAPVVVTSSTGSAAGKIPVSSQRVSSRSVRSRSKLPLLRK